MTELGEYGLELDAWRRSQEATARITRTLGEGCRAARTAGSEDARSADDLPVAPPPAALGYGSEVA